jgi:hypothetical protein
MSESGRGVEIVAKPTPTGDVLSKDQRRFISWHAA